jgi:hypothetical protein
MIGAKRRRLHGGEESELLPTAPVALLMATIEPGGMIVDGADAIPTKAAGVSPTAASGAQTLALGAHVTPSSATYDDEEEEEAMNDGFAGADDEEAALNDGDEYDDAYNNDDPTPMTAEEAFDAFEFGDWYDPAGEDGADGDGAAATGATAHRDDAEDDDDELSETEVDEAELEPHEPRHVGREPSLSLIQGFSDVGRRPFSPVRQPTTPSSGLTLRRAPAENDTGRPEAYHGPSRDAGNADARARSRSLGIRPSRPPRPDDGPADGRADVAPPLACPGLPRCHRGPRRGARR